MIAIAGRARGRDFRYGPPVPRLRWTLPLASLALLLEACGGEVDDGATVDAAIDAVPVVCGDGVVAGAEQCDDANTDDTDGCVACAFARCGDGQVRAGVETCDDGDIRCVRCTTCAGTPDQTTGHCYTMIEATAARAAAQASCAAAGGHLAILDAPGEWQAIAPLWTAPYAATWLGLTRAVDGQNQWAWEDGQPLATPTWNAGEPNDSGGIEDCVEAGGMTGGWNDLACNQVRRALCERPTWTIDPETNHAYRIFYGLKTHAEAIAACAQAGAHLATVTTAEEQAFVATLSRRELWIGLFQGPSEGAWFWSTGERFDFDAWGPMQPDDFQSNEDCVHLRADGLWNDRDCTTRLPYLCEVH